jgi:hypothetical protein
MLAVRCAFSDGRQFLSQWLRREYHVDALVARPLCLSLDTRASTWFEKISTSTKTALVASGKWTCAVRRIVAEHTRFLLKRDRLSSWREASTSRETNAGVLFVGCSRTARVFHENRCSDRGRREMWHPCTGNIGPFCCGSVTTALENALW